MARHRYTWMSALRELGFWILAALVSLPVYFLVSLSLKSPSEGASSPFAPPRDLDLGNYRAAWNQGGNGTASFGAALLNSMFVTFVVVGLLLVIGAPAAYALARRSSRLSGGVFALFVAGIILPSQLGFIPIFVFFSRTGLAGTRIGLVLVYLGMLLPLSVFLYAGFFRRMPRAYEEAAMVDGATGLRAFVLIVLPLMRPVTGTVAILSGLLVWNDFFTPLIFVGGTGSITLPVAIYSFVGAYTAEWNLIFAGITIALAPMIVLYLVSQRYLIKGFSSGIRG
ncbi:carbohydrate ABC transporter permease [Actinomadura mexicana]|uniref:Carbohydrate ABC transporter membrane protein 2, CUT1 family n=1 Tax=Actinomadura mexicana TaxID=134959 RepID=A0A238XEU8_9ACTN|nr:carbohydrate ABC transporter permease [Actinomadura mexicana]SNR57240.1 carbohydrate ABC transporter membrane protein 2, CUT1 family [Actinomadura mexicana]